MRYTSTSQPLIIGHRGYSAKYPENTIVSFLAALYHGADGVELDVWLSSDGIPVVIHDESTKRVSGVDLLVKKNSLLELRKAYLGMGQVIPTLEEVFTALPRNKLVLVEVKDLDAVESVVELIKKYNRLESTVLISFIPEVLVKARGLSSELKIGLNIDSMEKAQWGWSKHGELKLYSINPPIEGLKMFRFFAGMYLKQARNAGLKIYLWTVNDPRDAKEWSSSVDGVITDNVEEIVKALRG